MSGVCSFTYKETLTWIVRVQALLGAKNFEELVLFMQQRGLSTQQIEAALEAHESGNEEAAQKILAGVSVITHVNTKPHTFDKSNLLQLLR